jgi:serine phosphatase RsbU (regulator of sigma subunit)
MSVIGKLRNFAERLWGQVRWQLAACYLLTGVVSVLVVAVFALLLVNMLILRGTINVVQRQVDLLAESAAARAESLGMALLARAGQPAGQLSSILSQVAPDAIAVVRCGDTTVPLGEHASLEVPDWLREDRFGGVVSDGEGLHIRAFVRKQDGDCLVETAIQVPLDYKTASLISTAAALEVSVPGPPPGRGRGGSSQGPPRGRGSAAPGERRTPPPESWLFLRRLPGFRGPGAGDYLPVVVTARDWQTGTLVDKVAFRVRPDFETVLNQMARYGQREAIWVWVLPVLGSLFLLVEVGALLVAFRLTRHITAAVDGLSHGAGQIGAGNLAFRIAVQREDQLGLLAKSFNNMADSLGRLLEETKEKERLKQEIALGRRVQESLYPQTLPRIPGVQLAATCLPARLVSGDLYDVIELGPNRIGLLCADVSGKGIAAALLMAGLQAVARAAIRPKSPTAATSIPSPSELVSQINAELCERMPDNRFVTLFWADYQSDRRLLRYTNAGHNPPLLFGGAEGEPQRLAEGGLPVGMFTQAKYGEREVGLSADSLLVIHTDGISEAQNSREEEFGDDRLIELCRQHRSAAPDELVERILDAVRAWAEGSEQFDDMTLTVMKAV